MTPESTAPRTSLLRRPLRPILALVEALDRRLTPAGRLVVVITAFAAGFGVDTTLSLGYQVFSLGFAAIAIAGIATLFLRARVEVNRTAGHLATVGEPFTYDVEIRNVHTHALPECKLRDELKIDPSMPAPPMPGAGLLRRLGPLGRRFGRRFGRTVRDRRWRRGGQIREIGIAHLAPGESRRLALSFIPERRGTVRFEGVSIFRSDPLGLVRSAQRIPLHGRLVVLPRRYPIAPLSLPGVRRLQRGGVANAGKIGESEEFLGLRDYRAGDSPKRIHWRTWARVGRPIVRENEDEFFVRHALVLDTFCAADETDLLDAAASVAASLAATLEHNEALLDLVLVEDRAYHLTAGRGVGDVASLLEIIANAKPAPRDRLPLLAASVRGVASASSGVIFVLLGWDAAREALVRDATQAGVATLAIVIRRAEDPPPEIADLGLAVRVVRTRHLEEDLRRL